MCLRIFITLYLTDKLLQLETLSHTQKGFLGMVYTNDFVPHLVFKEGRIEGGGVSIHQVKGWICSYQTGLCTSS
jgi:hypothetical protein